MTLQLDTARGVLWSGVQSWGSRLISFAVFVILARLVSPEAFGLVALANVYVMFIQIFADQGFGTAIEQRHSVEPGHLSSAFWCCLAFALTVVFVTLTFASPISRLLSQPDLAPLLRVLSLSFVFSTISGVYSAILRRRLNFKAIAACTIASNVLGGIVGIAMALAHFGAWALVGLQLTHSCVNALALWRVTRWNPGLQISLRHFKDLFSFGVYITGSHVLDFFNRRFDQLLIGYYLGPTALGYYSVAYRLLLILTELLTGVANQVAVPAFSRVQREPERMRRAFYKGVQLTGLIAFPVFVYLALLAPQLLTTLFGENWLPSAPVVQILAIVGLFHAVIWFNGSVTIAMGKPHWRLALLAIRTAVTVVAFTLVVHYGIVAVAAAYVLVSYAFGPLEHWIVHKLIGINLRDYLRYLRGPILGCASMGIGIWALNSSMAESVGSVVLLLIAGVVGWCLYALTIFFCSRAVLIQAKELARALLGESRAARDIKWLMS